MKSIPEFPIQSRSNLENSILPAAGVADLVLSPMTSKKEGWDN